MRNNQKAGRHRDNTYIKGQEPNPEFSYLPVANMTDITVLMITKYFCYTNLASQQSWYHSISQTLKTVGLQYTGYYSFNVEGKHI
jgi:hypothetical protein